jgi:hypothetical protein
MRALERTAPIVRNPVLTLPMLIDDLGERSGAAPALFFYRRRDCASP